MLADAPLVLYKKQREDGKHTRKEMEDLTRRWKAKKERDKKLGKTVNLNDFLKQSK